jgi:TonB-dependent SusC/RagA subfamily outer membrane receptor
VTAEDLDRQPGQPIEQVLMGRFPGVTVMRTPDGGVTVRIRGTTSIRGNSEPLYVIDGVAIEPGPGGSLTGINPHDIASIEVLKDPAETTRYGLRGANGVIVIKTKRPDQCAAGRAAASGRRPSVDRNTKGRSLFRVTT